MSDSSKTAPDRLGRPASLASHAASRSEVDEFHALLVREGIAVLDAPAECDYTPGYYAVFFSDPDGIKLEVVHEPRLDGEAARPVA